VHEVRSVVKASAGRRSDFWNDELTIRRSGEHVLLDRSDSPLEQHSERASARPDGEAAEKRELRAFPEVEQATLH